MSPKIKADIHYNFILMTLIYDVCNKNAVSIREQVIRRLTLDSIRKLKLFISYKAFDEVNNKL